jgi:hypothetical protein
LKLLAHQYISTSALQVLPIQLDSIAMAADMTILVDSLQHLLVEIKQGRDRMKIAAKVADAVNDARENYAALIREYQEYKDETQFPDRVRLERYRSKYNELQQELAVKECEYESATSFIGFIENKLNVLLQRLPLTPEWQQFTPNIAALRVAVPETWLDHNPDLETLELRLRELLRLATKSKSNKPIRLSPTNEKIDSALRLIARSQPRTQEEVFQALDGRAPVPNTEPFTTAGGWFEGYKASHSKARTWLSKRWGKLHLPPLPRGPKPKQK